MMMLTWPNRNVARTGSSHIISGSSIGASPAVIRLAVAAPKRLASHSRHSATAGRKQKATNQASSAKFASSQTHPAIRKDIHPSGTASRAGNGG